MTPSFAAHAFAVPDDLDTVHVTRDGVPGLSWPVSIAELKEVRDHTALRLSRHLRQTSDVANHGPLLVLYPYVLNETLRRFQDARLGRPSPETTDRPPLVRQLDAGIQPPRRGIGTMGRGLLGRVGLRPMSLFRRVHATAIERHGLLREHASRVSGRVLYRPLHHWFKDKVTKRPHQAHPAVAAAVAAAAGAGLERVDADRNDAAGDVGRVIAAAHPWVHAWQDRLVARRDLPTALWTVSGGAIWPRILRSAVRSCGGSVIGHDHGAMTGHRRTPLKTIADLELCDVFVTTTERQAAAVHTMLRPDILVQPRAPDVVTVPPRPVRLVRPRRARTPRRVMYASSFYTGRRVHLTPRLPDLVAMDWEARLFAMLQSWKMPVVYKPHPGSRSLPRRRYEKLFGIRPIELPFEKVVDMADVVLLTSTCTTVFPEALRAGLPLVIVDLGLDDLDPIATKTLARRASIVSGGFDEDNRIVVDWPALRAGIDAAPDLTDGTFYEEHYGPTLPR